MGRGGERKKKHYTGKKISGEKTLGGRKDLGGKVSEI